MNNKYIIFAIILFIILLIIYKLFSSKPKPIKISLVKSKDNAIKKLPLDTQSDISLAKTAGHLREVEVATDLLNEVDDPELRALLLKSQVKQTKLANNSAISTVKIDKKSILKSKLDTKVAAKIVNKFPDIPKKQITGAINVAKKLAIINPKKVKSILKLTKKIKKGNVVSKEPYIKIKNASMNIANKLANINPKLTKYAMKMAKNVNKKVKLFKPKVFKSEVTDTKNIAKTIADPQAALNEVVNKNLPVSKTIGLKKAVWPEGKPLPSLPKGIKNPNEFIKGPDGQRLIDPKTGQPITKKDAAKAFVAAHPDQVAKFKTAATKKVVSVAVAGLAKKVVGAALMPKGGFNPKKMAAGLLFLIPGFRKIFNKIFPAPVGPFLEQNMQLLYGAAVVLMSPVTIPVTLPPFLVQVMIALAIYLIMKNLQKIKDGLKKAGKAVGKAFKSVGKKIGKAFKKF